MKIQKLLENPWSLTADAIQTTKTEVTAAAEAVHKAVTAYNTELAGRQSNLDQQAAEYAAKLKKARAKRESLSAQITDLSSRGDIDAAAELDAQLEKLAGTIRTLERKHRLTAGATLKGDPALYEAAQNAMDAADATAEEYRANLETLQAAAAKESERLKEVAEAINWALGKGGMLITRPDFVSSARAEFVKVDRHFRDLDRIEAEAKARAEEQRKAEAEANRHKGVSYTIT